MPLTTAHAAAAWPVRRLWGSLPLVPLVTGTLSPDFEYLYQLAPLGRSFHSPAGIVIFCLPASLLAVALFEALIRPSFIGRLPPGVRTVFEPDRAGFVPVMLAIVIGAATHVIWDGFTHAGDWGVRALPVLRTEGVLLTGGLLPWYKLLQYASTVIGSVAIVLWVWTWWRALPGPVRAALLRSPGPIGRATGFVGAVAMAGAALNGATVATLGPSFALGRAAVGAMDGLIVGGVLVAVWDLARAGRARPPG